MIHKLFVALKKYASDEIFEYPSSYLPSFCPILLPLNATMS